MNKIELLAPAGDLQRGKIAIDYGADALYFGGKFYSLRSRASNFDLSDIEQLVQYAHAKQKKVYQAINILNHNCTIPNFLSYLTKIVSLGIDGVIVADPFIIQTINQNFPDLPIHLSTQQSICNSQAAKFFIKNNVKRIVLAREVTYEELAQLIKDCGDKIEIEYFVHGALCVGYSGQCMMSNHFSYRDANVGGCAQSCRWDWKIQDQLPPFSFSTKDTCQAKHLKNLIDANVASLKIEGRMKSLHYVATVVHAYRCLIDQIYDHQISDHAVVEAEKELQKAANRQTSTGWFLGYPGPEQMLFSDHDKVLTQSYAFIVSKVLDNDWYEIISKNYFTIEQKIEVMSCCHPNFEISLKEIVDDTNKNVQIVNRPMKTFKIRLSGRHKLNVNDIARVK